MADHLDFSRTLTISAILSVNSPSCLPEDGALIINSDTPEYTSVDRGLSCRVITYGLKDPKAQYTAANITYDKLGLPSFDCIRTTKKSAPTP